MTFTHWYYRVAGKVFDSEGLKNFHGDNYNKHCEHLYMNYIAFCTSRKEPVQMNIQF